MRWKSLRALASRGLVCHESITKMTPVTPEQNDALLPFIEKFEKKGFTTGKWNSAKGELPSFSFDEDVISFLQTLDEYGWVTPEFNWIAWKASAEKYISDSSAIKTADATTIQKLFTTHVRSERFSEGHLASVFRNGHILDLLHRLKVIRSVMEEVDYNV
ncbi:MAG: DUF6508 domain-containing protein [Planctomycetaceae bacterium]